MKWIRNIWHEREKYAAMQKARKQAVMNKILGISSSSSGTANIDHIESLDKAVEQALNGDIK